MPVEIGENLRHYRIAAKLGAGGMGEVYRAKDTVLGREVAIKILPEEFSTDPDRLGRFEREAKVLASLNQPHIAQIYGLEEYQDRRFLVLELVEGTTLAERIRRGPIPVEEAILIALQIAEALEAAHGRGIIHRDLKPANIMLTPDGQAKVLDFGIAKPLPSSADDDEAETHTLTTPPTGAGVVMGTPTYMSPEQFRGKGVDRRSDIWAFGVVLWEMLTGARLFTGTTDSDILLAVLQEDPDRQELPPDTPTPIGRLLRRCLERDPRKRLHDIADARLELEDAITQPDDPSIEAAPPTIRVWARTAWPVMLAAVAVGAVLSGGAVWTLTGSRTSAPNEPARLTLPTPPGVTINTTDWMPALAMSPDGRVLVFAGIQGDNRKLFSRSLEQFDAIPIPGTVGGSFPFFSPDGLWLGFIADGKLKKIPVAGGPPQTIADAPNCHGATWGPRGTIVFNPSPGYELLEVPAVGGTPEILLTPDNIQSGWSFCRPEFLPDGKAVLFTSFRGENSDTSHVEVLDLESRERQTLIEGANHARYLPTGHLIFGLGGDVHVAPFDAERREVTGPSVPVPDPIFYDFEPGLPQLAFSANGSVAFVPAGDALKRQLVSVDLEGRETPLIDERRGFVYPRFSPDGERLAVTISEPGDTNVWVVDLANQTHTKLTLEGANVFPTWAPDGKRVTYLSHRDGLYSISWKRADGSGQSEPIVAAEDAGEWLRDSSWSPDGETLVYAVFKPTSLDNAFDIWISSPGGSQEPSPIVETAGAVEFGPVISPDGRWLAYVSDISGRHEIYVQPFPDGGARHQISTDGGWKPVWSPDGRSIYFRSGNRIMAAPISTTPGFRAGAARALIEGEYEEGNSYLSPNFDIAPDGKSFVMIKPDEEWGRATEIRVILNWFQELEKLAPPD